MRGEAHRDYGAGTGLVAMSMLVWMSILTLTGTYLRIRRGDVIPTADWLVWAQLASCGVGALLGVALIWRSPRLGSGARLLLVYVLACGASLLLTRYREPALGYWALLAGAGLLTIGLLQCARTARGVLKLESVWFVTISLLLLKDVIISLTSGSLTGEGEAWRIGMGVTHASSMALLAGLAFWVSLQGRPDRNRLLLWALRVFFVFIIVASRTRIAMIGFVISALVWFGIRYRHYPYRWVAILGSSLSVVLASSLALAMDLSWFVSGVNVINRGQDLDQVVTLTGRTEIWPDIIHKILNGPQTLLLGYGYGVSRFVINEGFYAPPFYAYHAHSAFLEHILSTGMLGTVPFILLVFYATLWGRKFRSLQERFPAGFAARALAVVVMFLVICLIEVPIGGKLNPAMMLFLFYIVALDKRNRLDGTGLTDTVRPQGEL